MKRTVPMILSLEKKSETRIFALLPPYLPSFNDQTLALLILRDFEELLRKLTEERNKRAK